MDDIAAKQFLETWWPEMIEVANANTSEVPWTHVLEALLKVDEKKNDGGLLDLVRHGKADIYMIVYEACKKRSSTPPRNTEKRMRIS